MNIIFSGIARWLLRQALSLLLILTVLLAGAWLKGELKKASDLERDRVDLVARLDQISKEIGEQTRNADARVRQAA